MDITLPYNFEPREYQEPVMKAVDGGIKRAILIWHRRSGKDATCFNIMLKKAFERIGTYYYVFPTYSQGRKAIWKEPSFEQFFPKELIKSKNDADMSLSLINGSFIQIVGSDKVDRLVGTNPVGLVFSEYALQKKEVWDFMRPILNENGGWAIFNFTPRGKNHAYEMWNMAKENKHWFSQFLTIKETGVITEENVELEREEGMPADLVDQEYYCKFIAGAGAYFKNIDDNVYDGQLEISENHTYRIGVDLAKHRDYTVITPFDLNTFKVGKQERFNQIDWNIQKARIESEYFRYNNGLIRMDSTGVGDPIYDDLASRGINIEPYIFTEKSRMALLENLRILLEQNRIKIPNSDILIDELKAFQYELTPYGKTKVVVPNNVHDDTVMSLALAVWGAIEPIGTEREIHRNVFERAEGLYTSQNYE